MKLFCLGALLLAGTSAFAQLPPVFDSSRMASVQSTPTVRRYLSPEKIIWQTGNINNAVRFLLPGNGQADLANQNMCVLKSTASEHPAILFDFGKELHGGLQLVTGMYKSGKPVKLRIRFGESVSEAMSDIEPSKTPPTTMPSEI